MLQIHTYNFSIYNFLDFENTRINCYSNITNKLRCMMEKVCLQNVLEKQVIFAQVLMKISLEISVL